MEVRAHAEKTCLRKVGERVGGVEHVGNRPATEMDI